MGAVILGVVIVGVNKLLGTGAGPVVYGSSPLTYPNDPSLAAHLSGQSAGIYGHPSTSRIPPPAWTPSRVGGPS
jgi:hypothetical protein